MDIQRIRELRNAEPYKPFRLIMRDGRKLPVEEPHVLAISPIGTSLVHSSERRGFEILNPQDITDAVVKNTRTSRRRRR
jgi:hypothetical protein